jgi:hypothetical protein
MQNNGKTNIDNAIWHTIMLHKKIESHTAHMGL